MLFPIILLFYTLAVCSHAKVYFEEEFKEGENSLSQWHTAKEGNYGKFVLKDRPLATDNSSMGLKTSENLRSYLLSRRLPESIDTRNKTLVVQLSVRFEQDIDCGGGYLKILSSSDVGVNSFSNESIYLIMFGPDICGSAKKIVHAILRHKNDYYENKASGLSCKDDVYSHVYTLVLDSAQKTYKIKVDNKVISEGALEDHYEFGLPKKIKDPKAQKPKDWDDRVEIDDPNDTKPADWERPEYVLDDKAEKPKDWNDEIDGEWEAPKIKNPEYRGEWLPKTIKNPSYKGHWVHPMIDNPDYVSDPDIAQYADIGLIGFELWQVKAGTVFSDILLTDDEQYAEKKAAEIVNMSERERNEKPLPEELRTDEDDDDEEDIETKTMDEQDDENSFATDQIKMDAKEENIDDDAKQSNHEEL